MTQTETAKASQPILVDEHKVACDGGGGVLGHPKVWYEIGAAGDVICEYCGAHYVLKGGPKDKTR